METKKWARDWLKGYIMDHISDVKFEEYGFNKEQVQALHDEAREMWLELNKELGE